MATSLPTTPNYFRGHVRRPDKDHLQITSFKAHGRRLQAFLAVPPPAQWDSRTYGWIPPIKDQGQCGSCWDFSGTGVVEVAYWKAGIQVTLSEEYTLSCGRNGGCNGDDNTTVLDWAKTTGIPASSDYGPYTQQRGTCAYKSTMKLYKIDDWGFASSSGDTGQNLTSVADIKASVMQYGAVGCAVAAGGDNFWNTGTGTGVGRSNSIDHDVIIVGWDDDHDNGDGSKGAWIMRNSWNTSWGIQGYAWVKYGAYDLGTESVWAVVHPTALDWGSI